MSFGVDGVAWPISPTDFQLAQLNNETCVGAFFVLQGSNSNSYPSWVIGDTFLVRIPSFFPGDSPNPNAPLQKNVYTVFRASTPPAIGFAQLSDVALSQNDLNSSVPTPTLILPKVTVTAALGVSAARSLSPDASLFALLCSMIYFYLCL